MSLPVSRPPAAPTRLKVVPQGVDADFFDPAQHEPMPLPVGKLVFGRERSAKGKGDKPFVFLSVISDALRLPLENLLSIAAL